jgi:hypothetical protein
MVPMRRRLARDFTGSEEVGDHLGAGHGKSRSWASWKTPRTTSLVQFNRFPLKSWLGIGFGTT